jgi:hypothetical protein
LLAHIAEVDARKLYVPAGYSSMHAYCVNELHLSEDAAYKRIQAARVARQFPVVFAALAEGRLHLAAVCMLAPHLTPENAEELIEAATHRRKLAIEELLARRFAPPEVLARSRIVSATVAEPTQLGRVGTETSKSVGMLDQLAPGQVEYVRTDTQFSPDERFLVQLTIGKSKLRYAQALLSHAVPSGDVAEVVDRALDALIQRLERQKFGGNSGRPIGKRSVEAKRSVDGKRPTPGDRYVPAQVRHAVWERDQGQCTFVSANGTRCNAHRFLEFDHVDPVARGGQATVDRMRLRCRAHNQYEAEQAFGAEFMNRKRREAHLEAERARAQAAAAKTFAEETNRTRAAAEEQAKDVLTALRGLGCSADEARRAVERSAMTPGATLEERIRAALKFLARRSIQRPGVGRSVVPDVGRSVQSNPPGSVRARSPA